MLEPTDVDFDWNTLTPREFQVAKGITLGLANREIAAILGINVKTYDTFRAILLKKVGLRNTVELTRKALRDGFASLEEATEYDGPARCAILADYSTGLLSTQGVARDGGSTDAHGGLEESAGHGTRALS